jgi:hypothetical protein
MLLWEAALRSSVILVAALYGPGEPILDTSEHSFSFPTVCISLHLRVLTFYHNAAASENSDPLNTCPFYFLSKLMLKLQILR